MCEEVVVWAIRNKSGDPEQDYFKAELFVKNKRKTSEKQAKISNTVFYNMDLYFSILQHGFGDIGEKTTR